MSVEDRLRDEVATIMHINRGHPAVSSMMQLINGVRTQAEINGMRKAKLRVFRRTEIPVDAKKPTRDIVVIVGEELARIINDDISDLESQNPIRPRRECLCEMCGAEYPVWFAPSELWNAAMRDENGVEAHGFVCPNCFALEYEEKVGKLIWTLTTEQTDSIQ